MRPGDRVALLGGSGYDFARAAFGIGRAGAVLVPLNARLAPAEIEFQLRDSEASCLILAADAGDGLTLPSGLARLPLAEIFSGATGAAFEPGPVDLAAPHTIMYTSGTSGRPKGAVLTHGNFAWNAFGSALNLGLRDDDRWLACMPLFHVGGLSILLRGVLYGMTVVVQDGFDAARVTRALRDEGITIVSLVATMLRRLLDEAPEGPLGPDLRCLLLGGGPVPEDLVRECLRRGIPVAPTYGLTEAASQVSTLLPAETALKPGSAGKALPPVELRIEAVEGEAAAAGEAGEIVLRGPTIAAGYLNRPRETAVAWRGGWFHTGDFGYLDADGYLYVIDRRDDLIVTGGENVYPAEVEAVLESHPAVREAGVFALADARWGQRVAAAVALHPGSEPVTEATLRASCGERLAGYKVPASVRFVQELPRNTAGKLLRRELRAMFEGAAGPHNGLPPP